MKPPKPFKLVYTKTLGWSLCIACQKWRHNNIFHHERKFWTLCAEDYADYWENTDELQNDYVGY
jgi:hypothetical protein